MSEGRSSLPDMISVLAAPEATSDVGTGEVNGRVEMARELVGGRPAAGSWSRSDADLLDEVAQVLATRAQVDGLLLDAVGEVEGPWACQVTWLLVDPGLAALGASDRGLRGGPAGPHRWVAAQRAPRRGRDARIGGRVAGPGRGDCHRDRRLACRDTRGVPAVFGSYLAPSWLTADRMIPQTPTADAGPMVLGAERLPFRADLARRQPARWWLEARPRCRYSWPRGDASSSIRMDRGRSSSSVGTTQPSPPIGDPTCWLPD